MFPHKLYICNDGHSCVRILCLRLLFLSVEIVTFSTVLSHSHFQYFILQYPCYGSLCCLVYLDYLCLVYSIFNSNMFQLFCSMVRNRTKAFKILYIMCTSRMTVLDISAKRYVLEISTIV